MLAPLSDASRLPPLPDLAVEIVADETPEARCDQGFLLLRRLRLALRFPDGTRSEPFAYDTAWRTRLDAVAVVVHHLDGEGRRRVFLRSSVRPPLALRAAEILPRHHPALAQTWELPAGLVEPDEQSEEGLYACAAREVEEELGLRLERASLRPLGPGIYPTPAVIGERIYLFEAEVDPSTRRPPAGDGSPLERVAVIRAVPLDDAIRAADAGLIEDMKTDLALRRFRDRLRATTP